LLIDRVGGVIDLFKSSNRKAKVKKNQVSHWEIFYMNGPMAVVEGCLKYGGTQ